MRTKFLLAVGLAMFGLWALGCSAVQLYAVPPTPSPMPTAFPTVLPPTATPIPLLCTLPKSGEGVTFVWRALTEPKGYPWENYLILVTPEGENVTIRVLNNTDQVVEFAESVVVTSEKPVVMELSGTDPRSGKTVFQLPPMYFFECAGTIAIDDHLFELRMENVQQG